MGKKWVMNVSLLLLFDLENTKLAVVPKRRDDVMLKSSE